MQFLHYHLDTSSHHPLIVGTLIKATEGWSRFNSLAWICLRARLATDRSLLNPVIIIKFLNPVIIIKFLTLCCGSSLSKSIAEKIFVSLFLSVLVFVVAAVQKICIKGKSQVCASAPNNTSWTNDVCDLQLALSFRGRQVWIHGVIRGINRPNSCAFPGKINHDHMPGPSWFSPF